MTVRTISIGSWRNVAFEVAAWDGVGADVDLSAACLFEHEPPGATLIGGALHLDQALGGALLAFRAKGLFRGHAAETLLLDLTPTGVQGRAVLILGLGRPDDWTPERTAGAAALTARIALARGAEGAAFAPSLLDAGLHDAGAGGDMLTAVAAVIDTAHAAADAGLAAPPALRRFVFDAAAAHLDAAAAVFSKAYAALASDKRDEGGSR